MTAQHMGHDLDAIADSQHRNSQFKYFFAASGRIFQVYAVRPAGKNNSDWLFSKIFSTGV